MWKIVFFVVSAFASAGKPSPRALKFDEFKIEGVVRKPIEMKREELSEEEARRLPEAIFNQFEQLILQVEPE